MLFVFACRIPFFLMLLHLHIRGIYSACNVTFAIGSCITWSEIKRNYLSAKESCEAIDGVLITINNDICNTDIVQKLFSSLEGEPAWIEYAGTISDLRWCPRYDNKRKTVERVLCSNPNHFFCHHNESVCSNSTANIRGIIIQPQRPSIPGVVTMQNSTAETTIFDISSGTEKGNYTVIIIVIVYLVCITITIIAGFAVVKIKERRKKRSTDVYDEDYIYETYAPVYTRSRVPLLQGCGHPLSLRPFGQEMPQDGQRAPPIPTAGIRPRGVPAIQTGHISSVEHPEMAAFLNNLQTADTTSSTQGRQQPGMPIFNAQSTQCRSKSAKLRKNNHTKHGSDTTKASWRNTPTTSGRNIPTTPERNTPTTSGHNALTWSRRNTPTTSGRNIPTTSERNTPTPSGHNTPATSELTIMLGHNTKTTQGRNTPTTSGFKAPAPLELRTATRQGRNTSKNKGPKTPTKSELNAQGTFELTTLTVGDNTTTMSGLRGKTSATRDFNTPTTLELLDTPTTHGCNTPSMSRLCTPTTPGSDTPTTAGLYMPLLNPGEDASSLFFETRGLQTDESLQELVENPTYVSYAVTTEL